MTNEKILLVDDDAEFAKALAERMESRGLDVDTAESGTSALEQIEKSSYDAIILDLAMPGLDGIETLKRLLKRQPELQIILLTGHATLEKGIEAVKIGAADFLEKPADFKKLMEMIKKAKDQKMLLVEDKIENKIKDILRKKWW